MCGLGIGLQKGLPDGGGDHRMRDYPEFRARRGG
jgi:hypothetical protein